MSERDIENFDTGGNLTEVERYLTYPGFRFDRTTRELYVGKKVEKLRAMEAKLLEFMTSNTGRVVSRSEISRDVWGVDLYMSRTVDVHMGSLRRKIFGKGTDAMQTPLRTIRGDGYLLVDPADLKR